MSTKDPKDKDTSENTSEEVAAEELASAAASPAGGSSADDFLEQGLEAEATEEGMPASVGDDTDTGESDVDLADAELIDLAAGDLAAERLADLQRLSAEFKNYRRASEERIELERRRAKADAARQFIGVLDDLALADKHGDLVEGSAFSTIAQKMRGLAEDLGVVAFGAQGEAFDPNIHDAVFQQPKPDVTTATIGDVVSVGYLLEDVLVRPAKVVVWTPAE